MMESLQIQALLFTSSGNLGNGVDPIIRFNANRSINWYALENCSHLR